MSLEVKLAVAMAPVCLVAMVVALAQADRQTAAFFAFLEVLIFVCYRADKRSRSPRHPSR